MTVPSSDTPRVESFVLRFVADGPAVAETPEISNPSAQASLERWHGVVVHVQTNQDLHFTSLADAVAFIARYVPVGDFTFQEDSLEPDEPPRTRT